MYQPRNKPRRTSQPSSSLSSPNVTLNFNITVANGTNLGGLLQDFDNGVLQNIVNGAQSLDPQSLNPQSLNLQTLSSSHSDNTNGNDESVTSHSSDLENIEPLVVEDVLPPPGNVDWSSFFDSQEDDTSVDPDLVPEPIENGKNPTCLLYIMFLYTKSNFMISPQRK